MSKPAKSGETYYEILDINPGCDFKALKKAYYRRVKDCHPDLYGGSKIKEEQFKRLVAAFDVLSDPLKRKHYDFSLGYQIPPEEISSAFSEGYSIMDTPADDVLEEIIVGNTPPADTSLATLFGDLEKTDVFISFREGKNLFYEKRYHAALHLFKKVAAHSPNNILYRYFLAKTCALTGNYTLAGFYYASAINIGKRRIPPQMLKRFHSEMETLQQKQYPLWKKILSLCSGKKNGSQFIHVEDKMVDELNRAISRLLAEQKKKRLSENGEV